MKYLSFPLLLTMLPGLGFAVDVPDDATSTCMPWDVTRLPFVTPGQCSSVDNLYVSVRNEFGDPITGADVLIDLNGCENIVVYDPSSLEGTTDANGLVVLNPSAGGCQFDCTVLVKADGVTICSYFTGCVSTDWDGATTDGAVTGADFAFFAQAFKATQDACADYSNDGAVTGVEFATFAESFKCPDQTQ